MVDKDTISTNILTKAVNAMNLDLTRPTSLFKSILKDMSGDTCTGYDLTKEIYILAVLYELNIPNDLSHCKKISSTELKRLVFKVTSQYPLDIQVVFWGLKIWGLVTNTELPSKLDSGKTHHPAYTLNSTPATPKKDTPITKPHREHGENTESSHRSTQPFYSIETHPSSKPDHIKKVPSVTSQKDYRIIEAQANEAMKSGDWDTAIELYEELHECINDHNPYYLYNLAKSYYELDFIYQAKANLHKCRKMDPEYPVEKKLEQLL